MIWVFLQTLFSRGFAVAVFFILAKILDPEDFGMLAICAVFIFVGNTLVEAGFPKAIVQAKTVNSLQLSTVFWLNISIAVLIYIVVVSFSPLIAKFYQLPELIATLAVLMSVLVLGALSSVHRALLEKENRFKSIAKVSIIISSAVGLLSIGLAILGFSYWSLVFQQVVSSILTCVAFWRISSWRPKLAFSLKSSSGLMKFGGGVFGTTLFTGLARRMDDVLISVYLGVTSLGLYSLAYKVFTTVNDSINFPMYRFSFARQAKILNSEDSGVGFNFLFKLCLYLVTPAYILLCVIIDDLIALFLGDKWLLAAELTPILLIVCVFQSLLVNLRARVLCAGYSGLFFKVEVLSSLLTVIGFFIAVDYGLAAVVWVFVLRTVVINLPAVVMFYLKVEQLSVFEFLAKFNCGFMFVFFTSLVAVLLALQDVQGLMAITILGVTYFVLLFTVLFWLDSPFKAEMYCRLKGKFNG